ncbi:hypothetical protein RIF29_30194 [Crotalaria pallida]|uniref:Uncharacterized protein n=1 Tax=Crotalaria pallida TaxID=3830 RepID=A0AAN9I138_CROPI
MAKKKGKPPNQTQTGSPSTINESIVIDFSKLDEIDLDSLPATQVKKALGVLEEIKGRLEGRVALHDGGGGAHEAVRDAAKVVQSAVHDGVLGPDALGALDVSDAALGAAIGLALNASADAAGRTMGDAHGVQVGVAAGHDDGHVSNRMGVNGGNQNQH